MIVSVIVLVGLVISILAAVLIIWALNKSEIKIQKSNRKNNASYSSGHNQRKNIRGKTSINKEHKRTRNYSDDNDDDLLVTAAAIYYLSDDNNDDSVRNSHDKHGTKINEYDRTSYGSEWYNDSYSSDIHRSSDSGFSIDSSGYSGGGYSSSDSSSSSSD